MLVGLSFEIAVYIPFQPLKGSGLFAILITKVSSGFRCLIAVDLPVPESAIIRIDCAKIFCFKINYLFSTFFIYTNTLCTVFIIY
jgi:hypothetical protein